MTSRAMQRMPFVIWQWGYKIEKWQSKAPQTVAENDYNPFAV